MNFGENIKFIDLDEIDKNIVLVKYRKLINEEKLGNYAKEYIKIRFLNDYYDHNWIHNIYYYSNKNQLLIYFKKYYISTIDFDQHIDYEEIVKDIIYKVILIIKDKNIRLSINYIFDILDLHLEKININSLNNLKSAQIDFCLYDDNIKFFIKNHEYLTCMKDEIYDYINNIIYDEYKKIEHSKTKIAFCTHDFNLFNNKNYIYTLIYYLFKKGYWVDFIVQHEYSQDFDNKLYFKSSNSIMLYYDIIVYEGSTLSNLMKNDINFLKNKLIISLPTTYSYDMNTKNNDKNTEKFINYGIRNIDQIEGYLMSYQQVLGGKKQLMRFNKYDNFVKNLNTFKTNNLKIDNSYNDSFLERNDFFKVNNLDCNKKLVTIFIEWPQAYYFFKYPELPNFPYMEKLFYSEKFQDELSQFIKIFENNNCNVIFKIHPTENVYIIENKLHIIDCKLNINNLGYELFNGQYYCNNTDKCVDIYLEKEDYGIKPLIDRYNFIDYSFHNEIMHYTDYGIILTGTTIGWYNYIHDFPIMFISDKKNDWFKYWTNSDFYLKERAYVILEFLFMLSVDVNKLFCVGDLLYGQQFYWDDIMKEPDNVIKNFITKDFKKEYAYFKDHPMYGNTYSSTQEDIGDKILELISNANFKNTSKDINILINEYFMTIYSKDYVNIILENNEIIINIIKEAYKNNKLVSYGVTFEVGYYKNNCEIVLEFEGKIGYTEDDKIYPRIYTGIEWVTLDTELSNEYNKYIVKEIFDFKSRSAWRISSTSAKVGQKIYIRNITFSE